MSDNELIPQNLKEQKQVHEQAQERAIRPFSKLLILHSKEIIMAIVIGVIITVLSSVILNYIYPEEEMEEAIVTYQPQLQVDTGQPTYREHVVRANLSNALASLTPIKTHIQMYFQMTGQFPKEEKDIRLASFDLEEHEQIDATFLTEAGGIGAYLSENLGEKIFLILEPKASKNGAFIKWRCFTNIDEQYLGIPRGRMCEYKESL